MVVAFLSGSALINAGGGGGGGCSAGKLGGVVVAEPLKKSFLMFGSRCVCVGVAGR